MVSQEPKEATMSTQSVKAAEVRIIALEEELESHKSAAKRINQDIKDIRKSQRKQILNPNQGELKLAAGKKAKAGEPKEA